MRNRIFLIALFILFSSSALNAQLPKWILGSSEQDASGNFNSLGAGNLKFFEVDFTGALPVFTQRNIGSSIDNIQSIGTLEVINNYTDTTGKTIFYVFANGTVPFTSGAALTTPDVIYFIAPDSITGKDEVFDSVATVAGGNSVKNIEILRVPGTTDKFFVIYKNCWGNAQGSDALNYVTVDISTKTINSPTTITSGAGINEGIATSKMDCQTGTRWLFFLRYVSGDLELYRCQITNLGISAPVLVTTINIPGNSSFGQGEIEISPASDKIAIVNYVNGASVNEDIIIFDFDLATGNVSNYWWVHNPTNRIIAVEFSPDGKQVYAAKGGSISFLNEVYHFPVPSSNYTIVPADLLLGNLTNAGVIELAYDGRIYFNYDSYNDYLYYIDNPNSSSPTIATTPANSFGAGNVVSHGFPDQIDGSNYKTSGCDSFMVQPPPVNPCDKLLFIPNAFTPNGDGANDVFYVYGQGVKITEFRIFNRWGNEVFYSDNMTKGWDGTYKGKPQPLGVYAYYLKADGECEPSHDFKKGLIVLVR